MFDASVLIVNFLFGKKFNEVFDDFWPFCRFYFVDFMGKIASLYPQNGLFGPLDGNFEHFEEFRNPRFWPIFGHFALV